MQTTRSSIPASSSKLPDNILRFRKSEIRLHWAIALPFLVCYLSALTLVVFYTNSPLGPYRSVFAWTHKVAGICLFVFPTLVLLTDKGSWKLHLENVKQGWVWSLEDVRWLVRIGLTRFNKKVVLPDQGKFNAGEKLNFMMVMVGCPLFVVTGFLIWLPDVAFYAWLVHVFMAIVATPLLLGHIFMAAVNPSTRVGLSGMISGYVDRQWAKHHYGRWYAENFAEEEVEAGAAGKSLTEPSQADGVESPARAHVPDVRNLHALCLMHLRGGKLEEGLKCGRRALRSCLKSGDAKLAAELLGALWPHVDRLSLTPEEVYSSAVALLRAGRLSMAVEVCAHAIRRDPRDSRAIHVLLSIAKITRNMGAPHDAIKVYKFLLKNADPSLAESFRCQLQEAWQEARLETQEELAMK